MNITKKHWQIDNANPRIVHANGTTICEVIQSTIINMNEAIANAELIADAGNTANKCVMLPSQILAQRDELRVVMDDVKQYLLFANIDNNDVLFPHLWAKITEILEKTK